MSLQELTDEELVDDIRSMEQALAQYNTEVERRVLENAGQVVFKPAIDPKPWTCHFGCRAADESVHFRHFRPRNGFEQDRARYEARSSDPGGP